MVKLILHHVWIFLVSGIYGTAIKIRTNQKYGVLIDAGSSSSKLKIYQWNESSDSSQFLNLELIRNTKHKPGISSFVTTSEMSGFPAYLAAIVNEAKSVIPSRMINDTALFLMATAGIRILSEVDARSLIETARRFLSNSNNNPFKYYPGSVRILSGEEEAVFSWITTNYLQNFFGSGKPRSQAYGVLEMGGGSTQIAFIPDGPLLANMFPVRIYGVTYNIYAHSYLYYGQDFIKLRINKRLYVPNQSVAKIYNPCMLKGDTSTYVDENSGTTVTVLGGGDPDNCLELLQYFLRTANHDMCWPKPCAIGPIYQPSIGTDIFYAISAFVYAPMVHGSLNNNGRLDIEHLNSTAFEYCQKNFTQAMTEVDMPSQFLSSYCLLGLYIPELLTSAYGFPVNTTKIFVGNKINDQKTDWSTGAMIYEIENSRSNLQNTDCYQSGSSVIASVSISIVTLGFVAMFIY